MYTSWRLSWTRSRSESMRLMFRVIFTFFVKKIAIKRAMPLHAKLRDTTLMEVVLHGYAISDVHGSGNIDPIPVPDVAMVQMQVASCLLSKLRGREKSLRGCDQ